MKKYLSEFFGTAFLLMVIVGSGIMGENLSQGNAAVALLANSMATGAGLFVLINSLGALSGAHFNPVVSLVEYLWKRLERKELLLYWLAQISGAILGVILTHTMFDLPVVQVATKNRGSLNLVFSEFIATFGLISVIYLGKKHVEWASLSISAYIMAAYWFTSSTSFANPAVTIARSLTDTFCGIAPKGVPLFIAAQFLSAILAYMFLRKVKA